MEQRRGREGERARGGTERRGDGVCGLCDMVSVNIIINILVHIDIHDTQYK